MFKMKFQKSGTKQSTSGDVLWAGVYQPQQAHLIGVQRRRAGTVALRPYLRVPQFLYSGRAHRQQRRRARLRRHRQEGKPLRRLYF